jgi:hypothetical protein
MASVTVRRSDLYQVLGVPPNASSDDIAGAFRTQARRLHPDRNPGDPVAAEHFKDRTLAAQTLSRPRSRDAYDRRHLASAPSAPPTATVAHHQPLFRTPGRARAAVWGGVVLLALGLAGVVALLAVDTGGAAETVTLWIAVAKLLVCGPALAVAGALRLRHFATEQ